MPKNNPFLSLFKSLEDTTIVKCERSLDSTKELILNGLNCNGKELIQRPGLDGEYTWICNDFDLIMLKCLLNRSLPEDLIVHGDKSLLELAIEKNNLAVVEYILMKNPLMINPKGDDILFSILKIPHLDEDSIKIFKALTYYGNTKNNKKDIARTSDEITVITLIKHELLKMKENTDDKKIIDEFVKSIDTFVNTKTVITHIKSKLLKIEEKTDNKKIIDEFIEYIDKFPITNNKKYQDNPSKKDDYKSKELTFSPRDNIYSDNDMVEKVIAKRLLSL